MDHTYSLAYLRARSLPELYALRSTLQQKLAALPRSSVARHDVLLVLERIHWLLRARAPGYRP